MGAPSIHLPDEIVTYILQFACSSPKHTSALRLVSRSFNVAIQHPMIWRSLSFWSFAPCFLSSLLLFSLNNVQSTGLSPQIGVVFEKHFGSQRKHFFSNDAQIDQKYGQLLSSVHNAKSLATLEEHSANSPFSNMTQFVQLSQGMQQLHTVASARRSFCMFLLILFVWLCLLYPILLISLHHSQVPESWLCIMRWSESATALVACMCCSLMLWLDVRRDRTIEPSRNFPHWMLIAVLVIVPLAVMVFFMFLALLSIPLMVMVDFFFRPTVSWKGSHGGVRCICSYYARMCETLVTLEITAVSIILLVSGVTWLLRKLGWPLYKHV